MVSSILLRMTLLIFRLRESVRAMAVTLGVKLTAVL